MDLPKGPEYVEYENIAVMGIKPPRTACRGPFFKEHL